MVYTGSGVERREGSFRGYGCLLGRRNLVGAVSIESGAFPSGKKRGNFRLNFDLSWCLCPSDCGMQRRCSFLGRPAVRTNSELAPAGGGWVAWRKGCSPRWWVVVGAGDDRRAAWGASGEPKMPLHWRHRAQPRGWVKKDGGGESRERDKIKQSKETRADRDRGTRDDENIRNGLRSGCACSDLSRRPCSVFLQRTQSQSVSLWGA